jgi:hypothetical protein
MMDDKTLDRSLKSIEKECFVKHYELFRDKSGPDADFVVDSLMRNENYNESGAKIRVSHVRRIFSAGRQEDALKFIVRSERIPQGSVDKARLLLNE